MRVRVCLISQHAPSSSSGRCPTSGFASFGFVGIGAACGFLRGFARLVARLFVALLRGSSWLPYMVARLARLLFAASCSLRVFVARLFAARPILPLKPVTKAWSLRLFFGLPFRGFRGSSRFFAALRFCVVRLACAALRGFGRGFVRVFATRFCCATLRLRGFLRDAVLCLRGFARLCCAILRGFVPSWLCSFAALRGFAPSWLCALVALFLRGFARFCAFAALCLRGFVPSRFCTVLRLRGFVVAPMPLVDKELIHLVLPR